MRVIVVAESACDFVRLAMQAIATAAAAERGQTPAIAPPPAITAVDFATPETLRESDRPASLLIPLTLDLPPSLSFPGAEIYRRCRQVTTMRQQVAQDFQVPGGQGNFWLPVVLTAKGPLYCEVIGQTAGCFYQPVHWRDRHRQPLYKLAFRLLQSLAAPPATYLLQFGFQGAAQKTAPEAVAGLVFDRLWPFPAEAAIASLAVQTPNLFECHWRCLTHQPILDICIEGNVPYWEGAS